jgi:2-C-methyl-D-erythritol 4-phosphate cytidylyltransferase
MGFDKLLAPLAGHCVLWHSIHSLAVCEEVERLTLVIRKESRELMEVLAQSAAVGKRVTCVEGGAERHLSVNAGLATLEEEGFAAIHDAARPLVTPDAVAGCLALARVHGAASCAAPVADTLKRGDGGGMVVGGVDRTGLWAMQTPQIFCNALIREAYASVLGDGALVTDEVSAVERLGRPVALYHNMDWNLKVTFPQDLQMAELVLASRRRGTGE